MSDPINGQNPRQNPRHRERGPRRFEFTYQQVADVTGLALSSVRSGADDVRSALQAGDLAALVAAISSRIGAASTKLTNDEVGTVVGGENVHKWDRRFPAFDLWHCGQAGCKAVLLHSGKCTKHGGDAPFARLSWNLYFEILIGSGYVPLHRLICSSPEGKDVHHIDMNKWNNRASNLEALSHAEHFAKHGGTGFKGRKDPGGRSRGKVTFTISSIATALGYSYTTVRKMLKERPEIFSDVLLFARFIIAKSSEDQARLARLLLLASKEQNVSAICKEVGLSRSALYRRAKPAATHDPPSRRG